jgi:hypothetical protein
MPHRRADDGGARRYEGPAEPLDVSAVAPLEGELSGHFDPIGGKCGWYGRLAVPGAHRTSGNDSYPARQ